MSLPHLSLADARNLHLAAQGLLNKPRRRASLEDIPATISRMSLLQIDTINIVARSPYLVLFSRLGNYPAQYSAAIFLIPICISFDTAEKRRYATYLILNRRFSFEF